MICTLTNLSPLPRQHWCVLTLPRARAANLPSECTFYADDGRAFRAVRGRTVGLKTVYRVRAVMNGGETLRGVLHGDRHADAGGPFAPHPWVSDDIAEMLPVIGAQTDPGSPPYWGGLVEVREVDSSPAHKRFRIEQVIIELGLHATLWVDLLHDDPVATFTGRIVWSDRFDPSNQRRFETLLWKCGECAVFDFARRCGIQDAVQVGRDWLTVLNTGMVTFGDGVALPIAGRILSFVSNEWPAPGDPGDPLDPGNRGIADLVAAAAGPVLAVCQEWEDSWLACGNRARFRPESTIARNYAAGDWWQFQALMQQHAGWYGDRPYGLSRMPGQTGNQADFGATKGTSAVVAMDPRAIHVMQHAAHGDLLRGYTHYDTDGQTLRAAAHPGWTTWSRTTHFHLAVSPDRLGKSSSLPFPVGGWLGIDDEHMSHNYLAAYMALADDPLLEDQLRFLLETDRASYRMKFPNGGAGATRAQGRTAGAWAQLACVADDETAAGFAQLHAKRWLQTSHVSSMTVAGPMRFPSVGAPDLRKPVYTPEGQLGPWCSYWELGLFLVGLVQATKHAPPSADLERALDIGVRCAKTMARFGCFQQNGQWFTVDVMLWNGGEPPPGGLVHPSQQVISGAHIGDVLSWTFAGIVAARELLPQQSEEWQKLNACVLHWTAGQEALSRDAAEWWAIADSIQVTPAVP